MAGQGEAVVPEKHLLLPVLKGLFKLGKDSLVFLPWDALAEIGPLLGPPLFALPYFGKLSSPPPQACGVQRSKLYYPHTGAALQ